MHKAGRYTAAILLVCVGGAVIADKTTGTHLTAMLADWWPLLFILLGIEYILFNIKFRNSDRQLKLDIGGIIFAVLIAAVVIVSTQSGELLKKFSGWTVNGTIDMMAEGKKFDKGITAIELPAPVDNVKLDNENGNVVLKSGAVDQLQVDVKVYVKGVSDDDAQALANESKLEHSVSGNTLKIQAVAKEYEGVGALFGNRKPRMDLVVTLPAEHKVNVELQMRNGNIDASGLPIKQRLYGRTTNGEIRLENLQGELDLGTSNGKVQTYRTVGPLTLKSTNGQMELKDHQGDAKLKTGNGELRIENVTGALQVETNNGAVTAQGAFKGVKIQSSNGAIEVSSTVVDGDWDVRTSNGKVGVKLPQKGDYRIEGEGNEGDIKTDLPLSVQEDSVTGTVGSGKYTIKLHTNERLTIQGSN
ncbi:hypothetical protein C8Z91_30530 [Paenibacillus elgii]|uniref:DUF4097 domain-containing protein n=1 Tax=Paenibacillus elgii TaxID=189691 RepID=A0A2T6FU37_9BACL|nr:DUF4097 family beta strand repeat-containing protein [Paenibacillus elgii]PUA35428.1 hypothetical protein C8Z91_30530 [Paenibacillus elgii]